MTRLQDGKFGRFEHSFHDVDEEIRLMAAAGATGTAADGYAAPVIVALQRLFGRAAGDRVAAR